MPFISVLQDFLLFFLNLVYLIAWISLVAARGNSLTKQHRINTKSNDFVELFHTSKNNWRTANSGKHEEFPINGGCSSHHPWKCSHSCSSQLIKLSFSIRISSNITVEIRWFFSSFPKRLKLSTCLPPLPPASALQSWQAIQKKKERHELGRLSLEGMKDSLNNSRRERSSLWLFLTELGETQIAAS